MDEETFRHLTSVSQLTQTEMADVARDRMVGPEAPPATAPG